MRDGVECGEFYAPTSLFLPDEASPAKGGDYLMTSFKLGWHWGRGRDGFFRFGGLFLIGTYCTEKLFTHLGVP